MADLLVAVDKTKCTGEGACIAIAPYVFELDEDGFAEVIDCEGADQESILEAAMSCPTGAITVVEASVGKRFRLQEGDWLPRSRVEGLVTGA